MQGWPHFRGPDAFFFVANHGTVEPLIIGNKNFGYIFGTSCGVLSSEDVRVSGVAFMRGSTVMYQALVFSVQNKTEGLYRCNTWLWLHSMLLRSENIRCPDRAADKDSRLAGHFDK